MSDDLESLDPETAVEMYLDHRAPELSEKTLQNHRYRLETFVDFCRDEEIEDLNELTGRDLHEYRVWRSQGITPLTLKGNLATLRVFLEFLAAIDAVPQGMREKVVLPDVSPGEESRDEQLEAGRAEVILDYLDDFEYASRAHVVFAILVHTGIRLGTLRALDVDDWDPEDSALRIRHRPTTETPLKNQEAAERRIAVGPEYGQVIDDYLEHNRVDATDDYGREPLITTRSGRMSATAIRKLVYRKTRPCVVGLDCPHDRDEATCEALESGNARECPSSRSPHAIRRGAITRMLREAVPEEVVSDRSDATSDVLEQHYDERTERERMEIRREFLTDE